MLARLAGTAAIAAAVVGLAVAAASLLDPTLPDRLLGLSPRAYAAIGGAWLLATVAADLLRARGGSPRRRRALTLPPLRRR